MRSLLIPAAFAAVALAGRPADAQPNLPPSYRHEHEHETSRRPGRGVSDPIPLIRQRTDALAQEVENIQEHLEDHLTGRRDDREMRRLFQQADAVLAEVLHFQRDLRSGVDPREIYEHFGHLDKQVHSLMQSVQSSNDPYLRRAGSRLAYTDEQLHAAVATSAGRTTPQFIARQAHVLAGEAERLERAAQMTIQQQDRQPGGRHAGDRELLSALHKFVERVEHFHETAETEQDLGHLREDFALVDQSWRQVVELLNRNPHSAYFYRRADRVSSMHDDLRRVLGARGERRTIRFNIGGIDINLNR